MLHTLFDVKRFHPVIKPDGPLPHIDLSSGFNPDALDGKKWGAGGYAEPRPRMYTSPIYEGRRHIHMGIDIWAPEGTPVYSFYDGEIFGIRDNDNPLDYGPTIVTEHVIDGTRLYALFGHMSRECLKTLFQGMAVKKGDMLGTLGSAAENGGWIPHLHFQLSWMKPEEPDMPGVVAPDELEDALARYPDPRIVLGPVY
jgi:peptidoglycan LD-endopeptidase LytH